MNLPESILAQSVTDDRVYIEQRKYISFRLVGLRLPAAILPSSNIYKIHLRSTRFSLSKRIRARIMPKEDATQPAEILGCLIELGSRDPHSPRHRHPLTRQMSESLPNKR